MAGLELLVGGWFATPVIKSVIEKAHKYLGANYEFQKDTQGMVEELTNTLLLCQATVTEAEKGEIINNPAVGDWLRRLKLAVYDAEDVLDNIEAQYIKEEVQGKNKVRKLASSSLSLVRHVVLSENNHKGLKKDARVREFFPLLSKLTISNNETLREAPLHLFSLSLKKLTIDGCNSLVSLENSIHHLSCLTHLELCNSSTSVSFDPLDMLLLEDINLENCSELKIEGDLHSLIHLKRLKLVNCSNLLSKYSTKNQQKGKGLQVHQEGLPSLTHIEADHSLLHHEYHLILGRLPSLRVLNFKNSEFTRFTNHQILWFQELTALQEIHFSNCEFGHLPASLTQLSSLKKMELISCTKLESLSDSMPPNLQELFIDNCSKNLVRLCNAYPWQPTIISLGILIHIDHYKNYKEKFPFYPTAHSVRSMTIQKQQISDAIGQQTCASCHKRFKRRALVLRNWWP
ncbi:putative disease resistance protein RGA3 [Carex littledalei]|uniref:Putative disease resistance protein RGA3 n=1 Tax=Carex littledalei TaxID=544730 RepID=A0A833RBI4_9POAL|nr:putative disease resistance protein RGA3 [Carex littledalei]